jgi:hypothetical protein
MNAGQRFGSIGMISATEIRNNREVNNALIGLKAREE